MRLFVLAVAVAIVALPISANFASAGFGSWLSRHCCGAPGLDSQQPLAIKPAHVGDARGSYLATVAAKKDDPPSADICTAIGDDQCCCNSNNGAAKVGVSCSDAISQSLVQKLSPPLEEDFLLDQALNGVKADRGKADGSLVPAKTVLRGEKCLAFDNSTWSRSMFRALGMAKGGAFTLLDGGRYLYGAQGCLQNGVHTVPTPSWRARRPLPWVSGRFSNGMPVTVQFSGNTVEPWSDRALAVAVSAAIEKMGATALQFERTSDAQIGEYKQTLAALGAIFAKKTALKVNSVALTDPAFAERGSLAPLLTALNLDAPAPQPFWKSVRYLRLHHGSESRFSGPSAVWDAVPDLVNPMPALEQLWVDSEDCWAHPQLVAESAAAQIAENRAFVCTWGSRALAIKRAILLEHYRSATPQPDDLAVALQLQSPDHDPHIASELFSWSQPMADIFQRVTMFSLTVDPPQEGDAVPNLDRRLYSFDKAVSRLLRSMPRLKRLLIGDLAGLRMTPKMHGLDFVAGLPTTLRHLAIARMPATDERILHLAKLVEMGSLQSISLHLVHVSKTASPGSADVSLHRHYEPLLLVLAESETLQRVNLRVEVVSGLCFDKPLLRVRSQRGLRLDSKRWLRSMQKSTEKVNLSPSAIAEIITGIFRGVARTARWEVNKSNELTPVWLPDAGSSNLATGKTPSLGGMFYPSLAMVSR